MGTLYEVDGATGVETSDVNSSIIKEVSQASDFPATLAANTTYVVRGAITLTTGR